MFVHLTAEIQARRLFLVSSNTRAPSCLLPIRKTKKKTAHLSSYLAGHATWQCSQLHSNFVPLLVTKNVLLCSKVVAVAASECFALCFGSCPAKWQPPLRRGTRDIIFQSSIELQTCATLLIFSNCHNHSNSAIDTVCCQMSYKQSLLLWLYDWHWR